MKSNHLLLLALKKVREHVGEGTNTSRFLTSELGLLRSIQGIADVIHFIPMEGCHPAQGQRWTQHWCRCPGPSCWSNPRRCC